MRELLKLEWRQGWRSYRLTSLVIVAVLFALLDPPSVKYMPEILRQLGGDFQIIAPDPTPQMAFVNYMGDLSQLGALIVIVIAMGAVAQERERGVTGWLLATPVRRGQYLGAKVVVHLLGVIIAVAGGSALCYLYTGTLIGWLDPVGALLASTRVGLYVLLIALITLAASSVLRSQYAAGGVGLGAMFLVWGLGAILGQTAIGPYLPSRLIANIDAILALNVAQIEYWGPVVGTAVLVAVIMWLALRRFRSAEL